MEYGRSQRNSKIKVVVHIESSILGVLVLAISGPGKPSFRVNCGDGRARNEDLQGLMCYCKCVAATWLTSGGSFITTRLEENDAVWLGRVSLVFLFV